MRLSKLVAEAKNTLIIQKEVRAEMRELMSFLLSERKDIETYLKLKEIDIKF